MRFTDTDSIMEGGITIRNNTSSSSNNDLSFMSLSALSITDPASSSIQQQHQQRSNNNNNNNNIEPTNTKFLPSILPKLRKLLLHSASADITQVNPSTKGIYLGNVITTWGKGQGCLARPASILWANYCQGHNSIKMIVNVTSSGLKATTEAHGLTEYWNNKLTYCGVSPDNPKLFCWIYRHDGRKLKQELRCHALLCSNSNEAAVLAHCLKMKINEALYEFKREKLQRQRSRLNNLLNVIYETDGRSTMNSSGGSVTGSTLNGSTSQNNYKQQKPPPTKLSIIEESIDEEEDCSSLLPELTSYDKVLVHLLQLEMKSTGNGGCGNNGKYYTNQLHKTSSLDSAGSEEQSRSGSEDDIDSIKSNTSADSYHLERSENHKQQQNNYKNQQQQHDRQHQQRQSLASDDNSSVISSLSGTSTTNDEIVRQHLKLYYRQNNGQPIYEQVTLNI